MKAVITGDLIDSVKYLPEELDGILDSLNAEFQGFSKQKNAEFKIYRGDSFQGVVLSPSEGLDMVLAIKTAINKLSIKNDKISGLPDFRIAIGLGSINLKRASLLESNGEAFQLSGKALDTMKGEYPRLILKTTNTDFNDEFRVHFAMLDGITSKWSQASAEVVYYLHRGYLEREIAEILGINQSAVNQRKKVANWDAIELLLKRYKNALIQYLSNGN